MEGEAMKRFKPALVFAAVLLIVFCWTARAQEQRNSRNSAPDQPGEEDILNRELWQFAKGTPYEVAERHIDEKRKTEPAPTAEVVLPNGWKIAPAGRQFEVGRLPEEAVFYKEHIVVLNTGYYLKQKEPQEISIVDPASGEVKALLPGSLFPCAVAGLDGDLYISGGYDQAVYRYNDKFGLVQKYSVKGYAAGLAPIDHDHLAVVYLMVVANNPKSEKIVLYGKGKLAILNTKTGKIEPGADAGYFPHTVRYLNGKLYVTILGEDKLNVYDSQANLLKSLNVGKTPQDICPDPQANRLYVVNTGSDNLSVVDAGKDEVVSKIPVGSHGEGFGCGPTSCAVDGDRLFVTLAYTNAVGIFDKREGKRLGFIPTGWYPTKVISIPGKEWVAVLSAKGIKGRRPNVNGPQPIPEKGGQEYVLTLLKGTLGIIRRDQIEANLHAWTRQVEEGSPIYGFRKGIMPPIRHVFFIVRENRTYDQVLGDLGRGNGDPYLTLFGEKITPNAHELARQFVTLDNYFANGEISVLGHSYTTSGYASPFMELMGNMKYSGRYEGYPFGCVPALCSPRYLWDELEGKNIDYRIYGENYFLYTRAQRIIKESFEPGSDQAKEFYDKFYAQMMVLAAKVDRGEALYSHAALFQPQPDSVDKAKELLKNEKVALLISQYLLGDDSLVYQFGTNEKLRDEFAKYLYHYPINYPSWDLKVSDLERVKGWIADFENQVNHGSVAQFHYIWLPNDHTAGTNLGSLTPFQFVAQNDAALGIIIDTISKTSIWKESLILVTEDDAQDGPDHVDATRTVALAAGPYVKRGTVVGDRYDQLSMLRTIELLLGLGPLNQNDAMAVPMFSIFSEHPDYTPYKLRPPSKQLVDADREKYGLLEGEKKKPLGQQ
jgi:YVTN family beta-propeller protein